MNACLVCGKRERIEVARCEACLRAHRELRKRTVLQLQHALDDLELTRARIIAELDPSPALKRALETG